MKPALDGRGRTKSDGPSIADAALTTAELGYPVLPTRGKVPLTQHGLRDATLDPDVICSWWRRWPLANLATVGTIDMFVIDFDVLRDDSRPLAERINETQAAADEMEERFPELAGAPRALTQGGGAHTFMRRSRHLPPLKAAPWPAGEVRRGDIRAQGSSYALVAPSRTATGRYSWVRPLVPIESLPEASDALVQYLVPPPLPPREAAPPLQPRSLGRYAAAALQGEYWRVASARVGERNNRLHVAAVKLGSLVGADLLDEEDVVDALMAAAAACGLPPGEAERTIRSGLKFGVAHPRELVRP